jgi:uncharacterized protein YjiS (DUF1127 family)
MTARLRRWRALRRYRTTLRELERLPPAELARLGIPRSEFRHLACAVARSI